MINSSVFKYAKVLTATALALFLIPTSALARAKKKVPAPTTLETLTTINDKWQAEHKAETDATTGNAIYQIGNMEAYLLTGNAHYLAYADRWARHNGWTGDAASLQTYLDIYAMIPSSHKTEQAKFMLTGECYKPTEALWKDPEKLFATMPAMAKMFRNTGDSIYLKSIQNGLPRFGRQLADDGGFFFAALARTLADAPREWDFRQMTLKSFRECADDAVASKHTEALFVYALYCGLNHGWIDCDTYAQAADDAWKALSAKNTNSNSPANVGAFLLAACERTRYEGFNNNGKTSLTISITNNTTDLRDEVVEIGAKTVFDSLRIERGRLFRIVNSLGIEVPYQLTYDGKLLIDVALRPQGTAKYTVSKGYPRMFTFACYGRHYPERIDDLAWENDRCAYRAYGPALQRNGEKAYGYDVWTKNTPDLVAEDMYHNEEVMHSLQRTIRDRAVIDSLERNMSYHFEHGRSLDPYTVGPTLGCGVPAIVDGNNIIMPYCYKNYDIKDLGPLRFTFALDYNPTKIKGDTAMVEHRIVSIDKGTNFNKTTVWYDGLTDNVDFASGIVIHKDDTKSVTMGDNYVLYADPTDKPQHQGFQTFLAVIFPNGNVETKRLMLDKAQGQYAGHALCIERDAAPTAKHTYYFGSAWSRYDCRSMDEWKLRTEAVMRSDSQPLTVTFE